MLFLHNSKLELKYLVVFYPTFDKVEEVYQKIVLGPIQWKLQREKMGRGGKII